MRPQVAILQGHPDPGGKGLCHALADACAVGGALCEKRKFVLFTDWSSAKLLAHEDTVVDRLGAASRLFITD